MSRSSTKEIKYGALLSYFLLVVTAIYGLFMTPFILRYVSPGTYGVYTSVASLSSALAVIDFGLGTTMTRYIARYNATGEKEKTNNFIAMIFLQFLIVVLLLLVIGGCFLLNIKKIYANTFDADQIRMATGLFSILLFNMGMKLLENLFFGITNGNEKFVFSNSVKIVSLMAKILLVVLVLPITKNVYVVVVSETIVVISTLLVFVYYCFRVLRIRPRLVEWDRKLFKESFVYTVLMFIQTLVVQFSSNVDNVLIGAQISATAVTVYSMALTIYSMYQNISGAIANLMLPRITKRVVGGAVSVELQNEVERFGRYQYFLLAAALGGIVALGKEFFFVWLGSGFEDCYYLSIILVAGVTLPTIGNVALSILRAQNKMVFRTFTVVFSCIANIIVTIIGIKLWGYWGAAIGTSLASVINFILMNSYYHIKLKFKIFKMLYNITFKTTLCAVVPTIVTMIVKNFFRISVLSFLICCLIFMFVYIVLLIFVSMTDNEKEVVFGKLHSIRRSRKGIK